MKKVNLLQAYQTIPEKEEKSIRSIKIFSILLLVFYCIAASGIFSYWFYLRNQAKSIGAKVKQQEIRIEEMKQAETLYVFVKQRLAALVPFFARKEINYQDFLEKFKSLSSESLSLIQLNFNQEGNFELTGKANSSVTLANFLDSLLTSGDNQLFKDARLTSSERQKDSSYQFTIELNAQK